MASLEAGPITDRFEVRVTADTHFGWLRTRLSVERTLMSYLRTAVSLIGFGFTIVQFFERLPNLPGSKPAYLPEAPYYLGLALISCGILVLLRHRIGVALAVLRGALQQGHRARVVAKATIRCRRIVAIEFATCRSGRTGGASGSIVLGNAKRRELFGGIAGS